MDLWLSPSMDKKKQRTHFFAAKEWHADLHLVCIQVGAQSPNFKDVLFKICQNMQKITAKTDVVTNSNLKWFGIQAFHPRDHQRPSGAVPSQLFQVTGSTFHLRVNYTAAVED